MTTEPRDDVALPHFEDRLWDELAALHAHRRTSPTSPTSPAAPVSLRRQRTRRTRRTRRIVAVAVTGVAAAATLVAGLGVLPGSEPEPAEASLAERIIAATEDAVTDSVIHTAQDNASTAVNDQENWIDVTSGWSRTLLRHDDGTPVFETGQPQPPDPDDRAPTGEPPQESCPAPPPPPAGGDAGEVNPCPRPDRDSVDYPTLDARMVDHCGRSYHDSWQPWTRLDLSDSPKEIGERLAAGQLAQDGTETVDGRELIRLRDVATAELPDDFGIDQFYLVDPETDRPVQVYGDRGGPDEFTMTFEYLPRTPENLELLAVPVPDGFTETDAPPITTGPTC
jgi:hypothetical protein